ncbi:xyloside xylosyltransferase 1-like isoform X2 [Pollicipes pollicipes]|uniref:xyloside xylosyltransferase 1-like isoform X2 n=2 Tax=Pollicipes pollicipes TaxID=41117 RepID=UPI0018854079|nr:xyloside xylosyltransferase 1-like isoform X2 [Pollicipes pollicipes]
MSPVSLSRRRLALVAAGLLVCLIIVLLSSRDESTVRASALLDQLESAQWRDAGAPATVDDEDQEGEQAAAAAAAAWSPAAAAPCRRRIEVGVIFTKADQHPKMKTNLVTNHAIAPMADQMKSLIEVMQEHFAPRKGTYYNDVLFFLTTTMHRSLPRLKRVIMMDVDISVRADLALLDDHFERFSPENVMGLSLELSPVYRHVLEAHRRETGNLTAGGAPPAGFPGLNSGVVLLDLARMRASRRYNQLMTEHEIRRRTARYRFKGHLGDQDLYTLLALDEPELFYVLPCGWNRQLCTFWRSVYADVFDQYFRCPGSISIYHGNCKATIPTEGERRA